MGNEDTFGIADLNNIKKEKKHLLRDAFYETFSFSFFRWSLF